MTVTELLARISARELVEWQAYDTLEPIGDRRGDLQTGIVCATMVNLQKRKGSTPMQPVDFLPEFDQPTPGELRERRIRQVKALAQMLGARPVTAAQARQGSAGR